MVYIAAPNKHLLVNSGKTLSFSDSPKVNFVRPSANVLFESVVISCKSQAFAVVLTSRNDDGARGVEAIKQQGGMVIAQDQTTSECFSMPKNAIDTGDVDFVVPLNEIAATLMSLVMTAAAA
jgi:two-component system chemotaxis response regulator CheB